MKLLEYFYEKKHGKPAPYYYRYSLWTIFTKPIRKFVAQVITPNCPFNCVRILLYRLCGFKIGKHVFIGMRCYLDDMCYYLMSIGNNCTISYGVYFACHGRNQGHYPIVIEDGVYIGMSARIISKNVNGTLEKGVTIHKNAVIGACALVNKDIPENTTAMGVPCKIVENALTKGKV